MIKLPKQMRPIILGENLGVIFHTRSISDVSMRQTDGNNFIITSMLFMQHFQDSPSPIPVSWFVEK